MHTLSVEDFLPQKGGINTQSRQLSVDMLQSQNMPPKLLLDKLRKEGVAEEHLPKASQLGNLKSSMKNDKSDNSKHRLQNFSQLKEHFGTFIVTSKEHYERLGMHIDTNNFWRSCTYCLWCRSFACSLAFIAPYFVANVYINRSR